MRKLTTFSGGMRQRFGIAQALIGDPRLVVVDEPTAGLDPEERSRFLALLSEIGEHVVVVLSTHIVDDVSDVCGSMAILVDGCVRCEGEPDAVLRSLHDHVWSMTVTREELEALRREQAVLGTRWRGGRTGDHVLHLRQHHVVEPDVSLRIAVDQAPRRAGLDPYNKLIDRRPADNVRAV